MILLTTILFYHTFEYSPSLYAPATNDYIITQNADTFYFLENISTPPKSKPISDAKFTSVPIDINSYGWPGHDRTGDQALEEEEGLNMRNFYQNRVNLTEEDMYYHPVAPEEFWSTWEDIDSLQRAKYKVTLNPNYVRTRTTNLYMPPGELITFEILPEAVGMVTVSVNVHRQEVSLKDRYKYLTCTTKLTQPKSTWGFPMGGAVTFELVVRNGFPVEINVTGCVRAPYFEYGVSDEKEWEETLRFLKAPTAQLSNGVIQQIMPSNTIRELYRMNDGQAWLRSTWLRSQEIAPDGNWENTKYTCLNPLLIRYDNYVSCGVACAIVGANFVDHYTDWANNANNISNQKDGNPWGTVHEINHHHQDGWGFSDLDPALSERTNNVLNTYEFTFQNSQSGNRAVDENLVPIFMRDHMETVHPYYLFEYNQGDYFIEGEWDLIFHVLGYGVFQHYMELNINNSPYSWQEYNGYGRHILTLMDATGYDCYEYCKWYCDHTDRKSPQELMGDKFDTFWQAYIHHPNYHKYFHPMGCFYASGYVRNNERFETARPFKIYPFINTTFDFNKVLNQFEGNATVFGDFVFDRIQSKRQSAWTEISKGVFTYQPVDNISVIDEALAIYIDRTTNEETICIIKLQLKPYNLVHTVKVYNFTSDVCNRDYDVDKCYQNINNQTLIDSFETVFSGADWIEQKNRTEITDIVVYPTKAGNYRVGAKMSERGLLYIAPEPLTGDFNKDSKYLVLKKGWWFAEPNWGPVNESVFINSSKTYIRLVVNNADNPSVCTPGQDLCRPQTGGTIFIKESGSGSFGNNDRIPDSWFQIQEPKDFVPSLIDFKYGNLYQGKTLIPNLAENWTANVSMKIKNVFTLTNTDYDYSQGKQCVDCDDENISQALLDGDESTEVRSGWWPEDQRQPFPHIYDVNFNGEEVFDAIYLKGAFNQGYYSMKSNISIYLNSDENNCDDIEDDDNLIWEGLYVSQDNKPIKLDKEYKGKYLRIVIHNNANSWKDGNPGMSDFAYVNVGKYLYVTNYKPPRDCEWEVIKDGYDLNGRAFIGKSGDVYSYVPDKGINQVAIVGDKFEGMGTAKVYIDGKLDKVISQKDINFEDIKSMKYASRSYMKILYASPIFYNQPTIKIEVESGEFRLTGFIVGSLNNSINVNNGPMPTQTPTAYPEQTIEPVPTDVPQTNEPKPTDVPKTDVPKPTNIPETDKPVPTNIPEATDTFETTLPEQTHEPIYEDGITIDSSNHAVSNEITFTSTGYIDGNEEKNTMTIEKDILLIIEDSDNITLKTNTQNEPKQDKYVSLQKPNSVVTIAPPEDGDYGKGELGIHPEGQNPTVLISTLPVPLNIFSDTENTMSLETTEKAVSSNKVSIGKIVSSHGNLKLKVGQNVKQVETKEIDVYNNGEISSYSGTEQINTNIKKLKLNENAKSVVHYPVFEDEVEGEEGFKLIVEGKASFNQDSEITLTDSSSIEFGKSEIDGVCKSIKLVSSSNKARYLEKEIPIICGSNFDCEEWSKVYTGNDEFPDSKCEINNEGEKCLLAYHKIEDGGNKDDNHKKSNKTAIIIGVVCAVVAVLIIVIVVSVVVVKKKKQNINIKQDGKVENNEDGIANTSIEL